MNLLTYLFRHSKTLLLFAIFTGAISGVASAALVGLINHGMTAPANFGLLGLAFLGLCALLLVSKLCSETTLYRLTQTAIYELRLRLSQRLIATPLEKLQALGKHRLLVILTEDVTVFANAFEWVPV